MTAPDAGLPPDAPDLSETQFTLEKLLGQGGFGAAYQVFNRGLRRRCVLKLLTDTSNQNFVARFFREAQVMANLDHPAIPRVHEVNQLRDGRPYFVMELVDGQSLGDYLMEKDGPLPIREACEICAAAAEGLAAAHEMGVVHRDIKLPNLLISRKGQVKVIDFGIAHQRLEDMDGAGAKTIAGQLLGTPRYMSPEQILGQPLGPSSDFYSLGVVLAILLTGKSPFDGNAQQMMMGHAMQPPPSLEALAGMAFPQELEALFARMMEKEPSRRFHDGTELARALRAVSAQQGAVATGALHPDLRNAPTATPEPLTAPQAPMARSVEPSAITTPGQGPARTQLRMDLAMRAMVIEPSVTISALGLEQLPGKATQVLAAAPPPPPARMEPTPSALQTFVRAEVTEATAPRRSAAPWVALTVLGLAGLGLAGVVLVKRGEPAAAPAAAPEKVKEKSEKAEKAVDKEKTEKVEPKVAEKPSIDTSSAPSAAKSAAPEAKPGAAKSAAKPGASTTPPPATSKPTKPGASSGSGEEI